MKTSYILFLISSLLLASCGTKKSSTDSTYKGEIKVIQHELLESTRSTITVDSIQRLLRRDLLQTITYLSKPDSLGRQYPERVEENKISETFNESEVSTTVSSDATSIDRKTEKDANIKSKIKGAVVKDRRFLPEWFWHALGSIALVGVLYLIYRVIRRFSKKS